MLGSTLLLLSTRYGLAKPVPGAAAVTSPRIQRATGGRQTPVSGVRADGIVTCLVLGQPYYGGWAAVVGEWVEGEQGCGCRSCVIASVVEAKQVVEAFLSETKGRKDG